MPILEAITAILNHLYGEIRQKQRDNDLFNVSEDKES